MKAYIISILGIVVLGVILEVILPEGQMQKYIRSIYSIFVLFIIILPITNFVKSGYDISSFFKYDTQLVNSEFMEYVNKDKKENLEDYIVNVLEEAGISNISANIELENSTYFAIKSLTINCKNMVIDLDLEHINKYDYITECVTKYTDIKEGQVIFDE